MKKLFFLVAAIALGWLSSSAETYNYADWLKVFGAEEGTMVTLNSGQEYTSADGNFKFKYDGSKSSGTNAYGMLSVQEGTFTITAVNGNLKSVDFGTLYVSYNEKAIKSVSSGAVSFDGKTLWTGDAQSVTFTIDANNPLYTYELNIETGEGGTGGGGDTPQPETVAYADWLKVFNISEGAMMTLTSGQEYTSADGKFKFKYEGPKSAGISAYGMLSVQEGTFTVTAVNGNLKSIDFGGVYLSYNKKALIGVSTGELDLTTTTLWKGDAPSVTFTIDANNPLYTYELKIETGAGSGGGDTPEPEVKPSVTYSWAGQSSYSPNTVSFSYQDLPADKVITFKGKDLKGDITLTCSENITTATTTITKEQAEAADGYAVTFNFDPKVANETGTVTVATEGMDDAVITFDSAYGYVTQTITSFSGINGAGTYIYKGEGLVTFHQTKDMKQEYVSGQGYVTSEVDANNYYIQDEGGAIKLVAPSDITCNLNAGDKVTGFKFEVTGSSKNYYIYTLKEAAPTVSSTGNAVVPAEITLDQIVNNNNRLVTIKDLTSDNGAGKTCALSSMFNLTQGSVKKTYCFRVFAGTDVVGYTMPEGSFDLTGLVTNGAYIYPRSTADIVTGAPVEKTPEISLYNAEYPTSTTNYITINGYAPLVSKVIVKGKNLKGDVTLSCENQYVSFDKTTLAKADVESEAGATVAITINPAETGKFDAIVKFATEGLDKAQELTLSTGDYYVVNVIKKVEKISEVIEKAGVYQVANDPITITYCAWDSYFAYAQNANTALRLYLGSVNYNAPEEYVLKSGDEIKNFFISVEAPSEYRPQWTYSIETTDPTTGVPVYEGDRHYYDFVSRDNVVTPEVITLDQAAAKANRLVKVEGVQFQNLTDGQKFELTVGDYAWQKEETAYAVKAGGKDGFVKPFAGEIYGTEIPTAEVAVTGIAAVDATVMPYDLKCFEGAAAETAELNVSTTTIALANQKMPCERKVVLTGKGLTGDVTVKCPEGVTATPATIAAADINGVADGAEVTLRFDIATATFDGKVEFECADLDAPKTVQVTGTNLIPLLRAENIAAAKALNQNGNMIMISGEATVTQVIKNNDGKVTTFYMQDENRGMKIDTEGLLISGKEFPQPAIGDKLKDVVVSVYDGFALVANGLDQYLTIVSSGNVVTPKEAAGLEALELEDLDMLVIVKDAVFEVPEGTTTFQKGGLYPLKSPTDQIDVTPFDALDGVTIPTSRVNVTGIFAPDLTIPNYYVLRPRTEADIQTSANPDAPTAIVTQTFTDNAAVALGKSAVIAQYTVEVANLTADATVTFEGEGADQFTADPATISKEPGKTTLKVTFTPKAIGTYNVKMNLNFGVEAINKTIELTGKAYDAENLPEVTLDEYKFNIYAPVGQSASKTVKMTMKNCYAPVTITPKDAQNTTVTLNTTSVEPSAEPFELVVTFTPTAEGNGIQMFDITTEQIKTVAVLVVNTSTKDDAIAIVAADADGFYRVYNTNGVMLLETRDAARLAELTPGLYIINGKKFIVR